MIAGKLANLAIEKKRFAPGIVKALEYLEGKDFTAMEIGKYEIDGKNLYALVQEYQTAPKADKKAEAHVKYIDVQFIAAGVESLGFAPLGSEHVVKEDKLAEKDGIYYSTVVNESEIILKSGEYAVFFPEDVHRPGCQAGESATVRKVVLKVAVDSI